MGGSLLLGREQKGSGVGGSLALGRESLPPASPTAYRWGPGVTVMMIIGSQSNLEIRFQGALGGGSGHPQFSHTRTG